MIDVLKDVNLVPCHLPPRPISLISCVSLHSSLAMQCSQTISMRTREECLRPLAYEPCRDHIDHIWTIFFWLIPCFVIKHETFSSVHLLLQMWSSSSRSIEPCLIMTLLREGWLRKLQRLSFALCSHQGNTFVYHKKTFQEVLKIMCP